MKEAEIETTRKEGARGLDLNGLALFGFIVAVPYLYEGTTDQHRAMVILASLPFMLISILSFRSCVLIRRNDKPLAYGVLAILFGVVASAFLAERSTIAWIRVLELFWAFGLVVCVAHSVAVRRARVFYVLVAIAVAYCVSNFRLYLQWVAVPGDPTKMDWTFSLPGYFHFRNLGFAAAPALVCLAWLPFSSLIKAAPSNCRTILQTMLWVLLAIGWGVLVWSGSRAGVLGAFVGLGAVVFYLRKLIPMLRVLSFSLLACLVGSVVSLPFTVQQDSWGVLRIIGLASKNPVTQSVDAYSSGRITIWLDGLSRWADSWFWGIGPDQYASQPALPARILEPHNAMVDVVLESGIVGLCGLLLVVVSIFTVLKRFGRSEPESVVSSLILSFGIYSMVDGTLVWTLPLTYICILLGCFYGLDSRVSETEITRKFFSGLSRGLAVAVVLPCVGVFGYVYYQSKNLASPAPDPNSFAARSMYYFPATTWGINSWLTAWEKQGVEDLDAWHAMLISGSPAPHFYRIEYAYFLIRHNRLAEAKYELEKALEIAPISTLNRLKSKHGAMVEALEKSIQ